MVIFGIFDLLIGGGLVVGFIGCLIVIAWPRLARLVGGQDGGAAAVRRGRRRVGLGAAAYVVALALLFLFNVAYFNGFGTDPVIGLPTRAQVTGTWVGDHGATLVLRPDGTFSASGLPPYVGDSTDLGGTSGYSRNPPSGHGTWVIGVGDSTGLPDSVIFTFACDAGPGECARQALTFDLQAEKSSSAGGPALFYYLGDGDDWSDQYPFVRVK
jgi:hypothetical protein